MSPDWLVVMLRSSRLVRALPWVALAAPLLAQRSPTGPAPRVSPAAEIPLTSSVERFADPAQLSGAAVNLDFEAFERGSELEGVFGMYGLRLRLGRGSLPAIRLDPNPRSFPPVGRSALSNAFGSVFVEDPRAGEGDTVLVATFEAPVNRVGFELRRIDPGELNVVLRCLSGGVELGHQTFEINRTFRFIGLECGEPFDEVRLDFVNPTEGAFTLDNLWHELDLRDRDGDGRPDFADTCPDLAGWDTRDSDGDGLGDACDPFPLDPDNDLDLDGIGRDLDNCPETFNPQQRDGDHDGIGDACDGFPLGPDQDTDGIGDAFDNCPTAFNPEQADCDLDGLGDVCDPTLVNPAAVSFRLRPGECAAVAKTVCLPPSPPVVDVVIAIDTTASMIAEIQALRQNVTAFVRGVRRALPVSDIRFALVTIKDYPRRYTSCTYAEEYARRADSAFTVAASITADDEALLQAVNELEAIGGKDLPEAYGRALWEVAQPDSGIGFRANSARFVLLIGDSVPHDCGLELGLGDCFNRAVSTGKDPGRDELLGTEDDLDFHRDALVALRVARIPVLMIFSERSGFCAWEEWCRYLGGFAVHADTSGVLPPGTNLVAKLVELIRIPTVGRVSFQAEDVCGLEVSFDPPFVNGPIDVTLGSQVSFAESICVPAGTLPGPLDCAVNIFADDVLIGTQTIHLDVGCTVETLDFETEDDFETGLQNGQSISTPPRFGRTVRISSAGANLGPAAFDSTPGGPNDPSINSDMLIGHGNLLLLQDSARPQQNAAGQFSAVTDDPDGGDLIFDFVQPVDPRSVLLADINPPPNLGASVTLTDEAGRTRVYSVQPGWTGGYGNAGPHRLDLTTLLPQPGNGTNRFATAVQSPGFEQTRVVRIVVHMTGFGAMDELTFCR